MKNLIKKTFSKFFKDHPSKLSSKALKRASEMAKPRAGTPHDWEDYEKYLEEMNEKSDQNQSINRLMSLTFKSTTKSLP